MLLDRGFRPVGENQHWRSERAYVGYNSFWSDPVTGHVFEVQFHTEASYLAKSVSHDLFSGIRAMDKSQRRTPEYLDAMAAHDAYFAAVPTPDGAADVGLPAGGPRTDPAADLPPLPYARSAELSSGRSPEASADLTSGAPPDVNGPPVASDPRHRVTDAEALELARTHLLKTSAGLAFYTA